MDIKNLNELADQFKGLNPQDPGTWPPLPKAMLLVVLFIGILVGAYFLDWSAQIAQLDAGVAQEARLKEQYVAKMQLSINLDLYRQQLSEINSSFGALLKQLPNRSEMEALLVDINQAGLGRGLQFDLFKPAAQETKKEFYAELPIKLRITGSYHDIGAFASDIGALSRIVTLNDISLTDGKNGKLVMDATAKTFRYLDEGEMATQRRGKKGGRRR